MAGQKPDERIRTPMRWDTSEPAAGFSVAAPWQPLGDDPPGTDVATETSDPGSLLSAYRSLVGLRTAHRALAIGDQLPVDAVAPSVVAYLRHVPGQTMWSSSTLPTRRWKPRPSASKPGRCADAIRARRLRVGGGHRSGRRHDRRVRRVRPVPRLAPREGSSSSSAHDAPHPPRRVGAGRGRARASAAIAAGRGRVAAALLIVGGVINLIGRISSIRASRPGPCRSSS